MKSDSIETTIGEDCPVTVHYDFDPGQRQINYPTDNAQPGEPASITITCVTVLAYGETWEIERDLSDKCIDRLEQECWEKGLK